MNEFSAAQRNKPRKAFKKVLAAKGVALRRSSPAITVWRVTFVYVSAPAVAATFLKTNSRWRRVAGASAAPALDAIASNEPRQSLESHPGALLGRRLACPGRAISGQKLSRPKLAAYTDARALAESKIPSDRTVAGDLSVKKWWARSRHEFH